MELREVRALFPIMERRSYLFSGGIAPASTRMLAAIDDHLSELTNDPCDLYNRTHEAFIIARQLFADLIGADEDEIAITDCTGTGSNLAVEMIEPRPGANVVFDELAYASATFPWMLPPRAHVERRFVRQRNGLVHLEDLAEAIDRDTLAVSICHVSQITGFRHDLGAVAKLAHRNNALLLVDAAQSAGALQIDVHKQGVDFLACGAMKFLLGTAGIGFFYAAKRHLDRHPPHAGGPGSVADHRPWGVREFKPRPGADRFRIGMPNLMGLAATIPGLDILTEVGMQRVEEHVLDLTGYCIQGLLERGMTVKTSHEAKHRAGIVSVELDDASGLSQDMRNQGIDLYHTNNLLRIDPHIFNSRVDIDRVFAALDNYSARR